MSFIWGGGRAGGELPTAPSAFRAASAPFAARSSECVASGQRNTRFVTVAGDDEDRRGAGGFLLRPAGCGPRVRVSACSRRLPLPIHRLCLPTFPGSVRVHTRIRRAEGNSLAGAAYFRLPRAPVISPLNAYGRIWARVGICPSDILVVAVVVPLFRSPTVLDLRSWMFP